MPLGRKNYLAEAEYYKEHGDLRVPAKYVSPDGTRLGTWLYLKRKARQEGTFSQDKIERLNSISMNWG